MVSSSRESWKSAGLDNDAIWGKREKKHESWCLEQDVKWYKQTQTSGGWLVSVAEWWSYPDATNYYHSLHWAQAREPNRHGVLIPWYLVSRHTLDLGSIMSSPRYGLSCSYRLTIRKNNARLFHLHHVLHFVDLYLVLPAPNLSILNASILIMMQQVRLIMFSLNIVDYSIHVLPLAVHLKYFFFLDK